MERVLTFEQALNEVLTRSTTLASPLHSETLTLPEAQDRVLAEPVITPRGQPAFNRSTRDGYAVQAADISAGNSLRVLGTLRAGEQWNRAPLTANQAIEIMTGAPLPDGADAVLMVEHAIPADASTSKTNSAQRNIKAQAGRVLHPGENIVPRGAEAVAGTTVLKPGRLIDASAIAIAASCGRAELKVFTQPKVAIIATGDELVELGTTPEAWQIYNSNSHALVALVSSEGGIAQQLPIARDVLSETRERIAAGATHDLLLLSGGVSMGKYDVVEQALSELDAEFFFTGARIQPGKPVVFGRLPKHGDQAASDTASSPKTWTYFFALPGNPVSTEVCFHLFVAPLLRALCGRSDVAPRFTQAKTSEAFQGKPGLVRFLPACIESNWRGVSVRPVTWQGSGDLAANAIANGYCVVEEHGLALGDEARVLLH